jgi:hypothetical protein
MYPREWFFNTDHHLIDQARTRHTRRIIEDLGPDLSRHQGMDKWHALPSAQNTLARKEAQ